MNVVNRLHVKIVAKHNGKYLATLHREAIRLPSIPKGLERNNLDNSDPKCVADLVGLTFTKPQA